MTGSPRDLWESAPCALAVVSMDGTVTAANAELLTWTGLRADAVIGRMRLAELLSVGGRIYWETHLWPLLHVEGGVQEVALELRTPTGRMPVLMTAVVERHVDVREAGHGGAAPVVHVALSSARERSRYERQLVAARGAAERSATRVQALQHVTSALAGAVGVHAVADAVLEAAVGNLQAVGAALWLSRGAHDVTLHGVRGAPAPPEVAGAAMAQWQRLLSNPTSPTRPDDVGEPAGPVHAGPAGWWLVSLAGQGGARAVLALTGGLDALGPAGANGGEVSEERAAGGVLTAVAQQATVALDRAERFEQRSHIAHELQHSLLAVPVQADPRVTVATSYRAGQRALDVGGDWYDVFSAERDRLTVVVGDVVGHGLGAAIAMGQLRSAARAVGGPGRGPASVLADLDRFVELVEDAAMATVAIGRVHLADGTVEYACAGHPPPLLLPVAGPPRYLEEGRSTPLGIVTAALPRGQATVRLAPGDRLLLYTDGLIERRDRPLQEGLDQLRRAAASPPPAPLAEAVAGVVSMMLDEQDSEDDVCVLLLEYTGPGVHRPWSTPALEYTALELTRHWS